MNSPTREDILNSISDLRNELRSYYYAWVDSEYAWVNLCCWIEDVSTGYKPLKLTYESLAGFNMRYSVKSDKERSWWRGEDFEYRTSKQIVNAVMEKAKDLADVVKRAIDAGVLTRLQAWTLLSTSYTPMEWVPRTEWDADSFDRNFICVRKMNKNGLMRVVRRVDGVEGRIRTDTVKFWGFEVLSGYNPEPFSVPVR